MTPAAIADVLRGELSPGRFRHTLAVARLSKDLARRHGADPEKAALAGLLHDCAKELPGRILAGLVRRHRLAVPDLDFIRRRKRYGVLHAYVSAHMARARFGVRDARVLSAVARHTLGHERMGLLDAVLYVADFASTDRRYAAAASVRRLARRDLKAALREAARWKIHDVLRRSGPLHPQTVRLWNALA